LESCGDDEIPPKDLNRALLIVVQSCSTGKLQAVQESIEALLGAGASVDAEDPNDGRTALMIACEKGYIQIVDKLI
jgi:ankyrin repeat protein